MKLYNYSTLRACSDDSTNFFLLNKVCLFRQDPPNKKAREVSTGYLLRAIKTSSQKYSGRECTTESDDGRQTVADGSFQRLHAEERPRATVIDAVHTITAFVFNDIHKGFGDEEFDAVHFEDI